MTNLYQPLDLTVNDHAKSFLKKTFTEWFASEIGEALDKGAKPEELTVTINCFETNQRDVRRNDGRGRSKGDLKRMGEGRYSDRNQDGIGKSATTRSLSRNISIE